MTISIASNVNSTVAQRALGQTKERLSENMKRLTSGTRVNRAGDDSAASAIAEKLGAKVRSVAQAERNSMDAMSLLYAAQHAMDETSGILSRMRELAVQSANDTLQQSDRDLLDGEFQSLMSEIDRISGSVIFNGMVLLDGSGADGAGASFRFQIGAEEGGQDNALSLTPSQMAISTTELGFTNEAIASRTDALGVLGMIDSVFTEVSFKRSGIDALHGRVQNAVSNLGAYRDSLVTASARIVDLDLAQETADMLRNTILMQSGVAVLAQANQHPEMALSLIG